MSKANAAGDKCKEENKLARACKFLRGCISGNCDTAAAEFAQITPLNTYLPKKICTQNLHNKCAQQIYTNHTNLQHISRKKKSRKFVHA